MIKIDKKNLQKLNLSIFFKHLSYGLIISTLILWQNQNGLSFTQIGSIQSISILILLVSEIPSSFIADKFSHQKLLLLAFIINAISFFILFKASSYFSFLLGQSIFTMAKAAFSGTQEAYLHNLHLKKKEMTKELSVLNIYDETGTMVGVALSAIFAKNSNFDYLFLSGAIASLIAFFIFLSSKKLKNETAKINKDPLKKRNFKVTILPLVLIFILMEFRGETLYQSSFSLLNFPIYEVSQIYFFCKFFSILGSLLSNTIKNNYQNEKKLIVILYFFQTASFLLLTLNSKLLSILSLSIFFFLENILRNLRNNFILKNVNQKYRATNLSTLSLITSFLLIFLNPALGFFIDYQFKLAITFLVFVKLIAIIQFFTLRKRIS